MTLSKYWGDEKTPEAIYAIYLKKVRYVPPSSGDPHLAHYRQVDSDFSLSANDSDHLQWETVRERIIKAGSLNKLVECLIGSDGNLDSRHFNVFFATYRAFATPAEVADIIFAQCSSAAARLCNGHGPLRSLLVCWMDMYAEDFYEENSSQLLNHVIDFSKKHHWNDLKMKARMLRERFQRVSDEGGLSAQLPNIERYTYSLGYDPNDPVFAQEHAQMFDISKDNCLQIAEQLTFWDAILFRELRPYQCQGSLWGRRKKDGTEKVYSVKATIDQFNAVSRRVMTSVVLPECTAEFRAKVIEKWIEVAKELRMFKNFSSLKAVLSSLQSEPVHRIRSAWNCVSKSYNIMFQELSTTFKSESNEDTELSLENPNGQKRENTQQCRRTKSDFNLSDAQGVVPYLGNFLTGLTMIDQAYPDTVEEKLVNFEKRRKEFEVLAKIRLFQSAARVYAMPMDHAFCAWFYYLPSLDEKECFQRSLLVEPAPQGTPNLRNSRLSNGSSPFWRGASDSKPNSFTRLITHFTDEVGRSSFSCGQQVSNDSGVLSEESWASSSTVFNNKQSPRSSSQFSPFQKSWKGRGSDRDTLRDEKERFSSCSPHRPSSEDFANRLTRNMASHTSSSSHTSSASTGSGSGTPSNHASANKQQGQRAQKASNLNFYLARVGLDDDLQRGSEGANYKCIKVENGDKMSTLVQRALEKHMMEDADRNDFCIVQLLPDGGELRLPEHCNPFYAVAPDPASPMLNFLLKRRDTVDKAGLAPSAKKVNRQKRSNLLRWSSGYL